MNPKPLPLLYRDTISRAHQLATLPRKSRRIRAANLQEQRRAKLAAEFLGFESVTQYRYSRKA